MPRKPRQKRRANSDDDFLTPISGPELVFGLVGPVGTDLALVGEVLAQELEKVAYKSERIHVTSLLADLPIEFKIKEAPLETRYASYIKAGNMLRERIKRQDAFALLCVAAIRSKRLVLTGDRARPASRIAYILNQFKRPEEIRTLRQVYGRGFIQISAYTSKEKRVDRLATRIAESNFKNKKSQAYKGKAYDLIIQDEAEEEIEFGQRLRDTFPLADVIIDAESEASIRETCSRFIKAYFGDHFTSPNKDEFGINLAKVIASRSADLSRQVGAVICTEEGEMVATGCNEVPKAGGGAYWTGDPNDARDFQRGVDSSAKNTREILQDTFARLKRGWLNESKAKLPIGKLVDLALYEGQNPPMRDSQLMDILEFGRIVHAEMSAITEAARLGRTLKGTTLYCTTFPCHICARHIISAGIARVVYIEPYSKSLAADLYSEALYIDGATEKSGPRVKFDHFVGIAPERYKEIFSKGRRKDKHGIALKWDPAKSKPLLDRLVPAYLKIEAAVVVALSKRIKTLRS